MNISKPSTAKRRTSRRVGIVSFAATSGATAASSSQSSAAPAPATSRPSSSPRANASSAEERRAASSKRVRATWVLSLRARRRSSLGSNIIRLFLSLGRGGPSFGTEVELAPTVLHAEAMSEDSLLPLLQGKRVVVCAGAGGVGKTTVAAAIALGFAGQGKRVLCITID